jgi:hypothetical protein
MKTSLFFRGMIIGSTLPTTSVIGIEAKDRLKIQKVQKRQFKSGCCYLRRHGFKLGNFAY